MIDQDATKEVTDNALRQRYLEDLKGAVKGKLLAEHVQDLSDDTLVRVLSQTMQPTRCLAVARVMVTEGLTIEAMRAEFGMTDSWQAEEYVQPTVCDFFAQAQVLPTPEAVEHSRCMLATYRAEIEYDREFTDLLEW